MHPISRVRNPLGLRPKVGSGYASNRDPRKAAIQVEKTEP